MKGSDAIESDTKSEAGLLVAAEPPADISIKELEDAATQKWMYSRSLAARRLKQQFKRGLRSIRVSHATPRPLFVITQPRTGSTLLGAYFESLPDVVHAGEVLNPAIPIGPSPSVSGNSTAIERHLRSVVRSCNGTCCAIKLMLNQLDFFKVAWNRIEECFPDSVWILLYRSSLLQQFVSYKAALLKGSWSGTSYSGKLHVNPDEFDLWAQDQVVRFHRLLTEECLTGPSLVLTYEELAQDPQGVFSDRVCPLLGMPALGVRSKMKKQIRSTMRDTIVNYEQLDVYFNGEFPTMVVDAQPAGPSGLVRADIRFRPEDE